MVGGANALNSVYLHELDCNIYEELELRLNENEAWKKVAKELPMYIDKVRELGRSPSPGSRLLMLLEKELYTVGRLVEILSRCELSEALALFLEPETVSILQQPGQNEEVEYVQSGGQLRLEIVARGNPLPQYLWLRDNVELEDHTGAVLIIDDFSEEDEGEYSCIVSQEDPDPDGEIIEIQSRAVDVKLMPEPLTITEQPSSIEVIVGETITLFCICQGNPPPRYEWIHGNRVLPGQNSDTLVIPNATVSNKGEYYCFITNGVHSVQSRRVKVEVSPLEEALPPVSEKVALLIANQHYMNLSSLDSALNDVATFSAILTELRFKVISLCNLTLTEMRNAVHKLCEMIPPDAYVIFYFAGHGFERHIKCMLPVDVPERYLYKDSLCEKEVFRDILNKKPRLLLSFLDMCRSRPEEKDNPDIFKENDVPNFQYENNRNFIPIYSTDSCLKAYEKPSDANGMYMKHLKKFLLEDQPITRILEKTHKSFWEEDKLAAKLQIPTYEHCVAHTFYLTHDAKANPVTCERFSMYNRLDAPKCIKFKRVNTCGIFTFSKYRNCFQNVLEIRISNLNEWGVVCHVPCQELDIDSKTDGNDPVILIYNIQKLKMPLTITISLIRENNVLVDNCLLELSEKPLIASAELWYERQSIKN